MFQCRGVTRNLLNKNYKKPNNGNFDDRTEDILRDLLEYGNSDEDDSYILCSIYIHVKSFQMMTRQDENWSPPLN